MKTSLNPTRYITILFLILFKANLLFAQDTMDSLKNLLSQTKEDTTRVLLLGLLSQDYTRFDPDSAFLFARQGLDLAKKINYPRGELFCKISIADYYWAIGDYHIALKLALPELNNGELHRVYFLRILAHAVVTNSYRDQGDYTEALKYGHLNLEQEKTLNNCEYCKPLKATLASIFWRKKQLDSTKYHIYDALTHPASPYFDGWIFSVVGQTYASMEKYDSALIYYNRSVQRLLEVGNLKDLAGAYNSLAVLYKTIGSKDSSIAYARKSLIISKPKKFIKEILETSLLLSEAYETVNSDSSIYYYKQAIAAKDSLYDQEKQRQITSFRFTEELQQQELEKASSEYRNKVRIYILTGSLLALFLIVFFLFRNNRQKQKAYTLLQQQKKEIDFQKEKAEQAFENLKATQAQLIQSEKMASLGELTAGIAHEIQNPLNFVNNFSEVNADLIDELKTELANGKVRQAEELADNIKENSGKINHHGKRAEAIVKAMLLHSRGSSAVKEPTDINALADEYLRLAYHGLKAKDKSFSTKIKTEFDPSIKKLNIVQQDIGRVILNLINNALYAVKQKQARQIDNPGYEPTVTVSTKNLNGKVELIIKDNGNGIPQKVLDKIFQPFFTTKPTGEGTGLGLSLAYDIVKAHGGVISVVTKEKEGTEFVVQLPVT